MIALWFGSDALAIPACVDTDFCAAAADPCVVSAFYQITDGCSPDFGARTVQVTSAGRLDVQTGTVTMSAGALEVLTGGQVWGKDGGSFQVYLDGDLTFDGNADFTTNAGAGRLFVRAEGITIDGAIDANARTATADGGTIHLAARGLLDVRADLDASGGGDGAGGLVRLRGDAVTVNGATLDARGGGGGSGEVRIASDTTLQVLGGVVWANNTSDSDGGGIHLRAGDAVLVDAALHADGGGAGYFAGYGGVVSVHSTAGAVDILQSIEANGASPDGVGGSVMLTTEGALDVSGALDAKGPGIGGTGGYIQLRGGTSVVLGASADASGGAYDGGYVTVWSRGPVDVVGPLLADGGGTYYYGNGNGGEVRVHSDDGPLGVTGRMSAQGGSPDGSGGIVSVTSHGVVTLTGPADAAGAGSGFGSGGEIRIHGGGGVSYDATLDASGGGFGGGVVTITSGGDLDALALIDVNGGSAGDGGSASLVAKGTTTLTAHVQANGVGGGSGGDIELQTCDLAMSSAAKLDAADSGGTNQVVTLGTASVDGDLDAGLSNTFSYGPYGTAPVFGGTASRTPAEVVSFDGTLGSCACPLGDDADQDSVCDPVDVCPGGDDTIDADADGWPDACPLVVSPPAVPTIGVDNQWLATGATPGGTVYLVVGLPGATVAAGCPLLTIDLDVDQRVDTAVAAADGSVVFHRIPPNGAAGIVWSFQAVDALTCRKSPVVSAPY